MADFFEESLLWLIANIAQAKSSVVQREFSG
jgi:hypothetical protein